MNLYSRKVIAHIIDDMMDSNLVLDTLKLVISRRGLIENLILHSDKGVCGNIKVFKLKEGTNLSKSNIRSKRNTA